MSLSPPRAIPPRLRSASDSKSLPVFSPFPTPMVWFPTPTSSVPTTLEETWRQRAGHVFHSTQLLLQTTAVFGVWGLITYTTFDEMGDNFDRWIWLWEFASPALVFLFIISFSSLLVHQVNCLSNVAHLWSQGVCFVLASTATCALVLGSLHSSPDLDHDRFTQLILTTTAVMWVVFFVGFLTTLIIWWKDQQDVSGYFKGKRIQLRGATEAVGYGAFEADVEDVGIDAMMQGGA